MGGPIILATLVVDTPEEPPARAIWADFAAGTGAEAVPLGWRPYPKLGPHSKVWGLLRIAPCPDGQAVIDAVEALAALLVSPEALRQAPADGFLQENGALFYNRIFDARVHAIARADILWLDLEAHTEPGRQAELAAHYAS